jgi:hypothetical protein
MMMIKAKNKATEEVVSLKQGQSHPPATIDLALFRRLAHLAYFLFQPQSMQCGSSSLTTINLQYLFRSSSSCLFFELELRAFARQTT